MVLSQFSHAGRERGLGRELDFLLPLVYGALERSYPFNFEFFASAERAAGGNGKLGFSELLGFVAQRF